MLATRLSVDLAGPDDVAPARALMMRVLEEDLGYGFRPEWHADLADPATAYLRTPGQALFLARDAEDSVSSDSGAREVGPLRGVSLAAGSPALDSTDDGAVEGASTDACSSTASDGVEAASAASRC